MAVATVKPCVEDISINRKTIPVKMRGFSRYTARPGKLDDLPDSPSPRLSRFDEANALVNSGAGLSAMNNIHNLVMQMKQEELQWKPLEPVL